jgi:uncharacterized protein (DUF4415 family)
LKFLRPVPLVLEQADAKRDVKMATEVITTRCCLLMLVRKVLLSDTPTLVSLRIDRDILEHFQEDGPAGKTGSIRRCER